VFKELIMRILIFIFIFSESPAFSQYYLDVHAYFSGNPAINAIFSLIHNSTSSAYPSHPTPSYIPTDLIDTIDFVSFNSSNGVTVITSPVVSNRSTKVTAGGIVLSSNNNPASIGICWSDSPNPKMNDNCSHYNYYRNNYFAFEICCLVPGKSYYARVFYANQTDTVYGNEISFNSVNCFDGICTYPGLGVYDINNKYYPSILLGNGQEWMSKNLNVDKFSNGDPIAGLVSTDWFTTILPAFSNQPFFDQEKFGKLYNWYTVNDNRNVCPSGWHVPSFNEFSSMISYLGGLDKAGGRMKVIGASTNSECSAWINGESEWYSPNIKASNISGFSAKPSGWVDDFGYYSSYGLNTYFWTNSLAQINSNLAISFSISNNYGGLVQFNKHKRSGLSIRCLKD
jgi:uncharacterized protein (TIGR02145 family)